MYIYMFLVFQGCNLFPSEQVSEDSGAVSLIDTALGSDTQADEPWVTPDCPDSMQVIFSEHAEYFPASESEGYSFPTDEVLDYMRASFDTASSGQYAAAHDFARSAEYTFCQGIGTDAGTLLWYPSELGTGRALIAMIASPNGKLILEAPHPKYDRRTMTQTMDFFDSLAAQAMIISGTHRCAASELSGCSGTTSTCGASQGYTISDPAHNTRSIFHLAHEQFSQHYENTIVISIHGMSGDGVSISNGTKFPVADDSLVARLSEELKFRMGEENTTTCNNYSTANVQERLCGTTNTQGRHLNGSVEPCSEAATSASERFLHLEQSIELREHPSHLISALQSVIR